MMLALECIICLLIGTVGGSFVGYGVAWWMGKLGNPQLSEALRDREQELCRARLALAENYEAYQARQSAYQLTIDGVKQELYEVQYALACATNWSNRELHAAAHAAEVSYQEEHFPKSTKNRFQVEDV